MAKEKRDGDCIFCKIARKEIETEDIIVETKNFLAFPDSNPIAKGHSLIIPKKHFSNVLDLPSALGSELISLIKVVADKKLKEGAEGFNVVMNNGAVSGQAVFHAHVHVIPRKNGDGVKFWSKNL
jgi:histidine triad (HIT) family protein